jgi:hypothetical protein
MIYLTILLPFCQIKLFLVSFLFFSVIYRSFIVRFRARTIRLDKVYVYFNISIM